MARVAITLEQAQIRLNTAFPSSGFILKEFSNSYSPCIIECPVHGEQRVSTFANALRSAKGCPSCGKLLQQEKSGKLLAESSRSRAGAQATLSQIRELASSNLSDTEIVSKLRELLSGNP